jgi:hypothetical protein
VKGWGGLWLLCARGWVHMVPCPMIFRALWGMVRVRVRGYHDALPRQILVHEDMVSWETPKKAEVRYFVHVALEPWGQPLRDHPPGVGEPTWGVQWGPQDTQPRSPNTWSHHEK